jgi:hypothetical protein
MFTKSYEEHFLGGSQVAIGEDVFYAREHWHSLLVRAMS